MASSSFFLRWDRVPGLLVLLLGLVLSATLLVERSAAQQVRGQGGDSATYVYPDLFDSYNFVQDQVTFSYREEPDLRTVLNNYLNDKLDFVLQDGPLPEDDGQEDDDDDLEQLAKQFVEVPVLASGITFVHNIYIPPINGSLQTLNMSRTTLAGIFAGTIRYWNDSALMNDNPRLVAANVSLPSDPITLVYRSGNPSMNQVLLRALSQFDPSFASVLAGTNRTLDDLPPMREGRGRGFPTKGRQFSYFVFNSSKALVYTGNEYATILRSYWRRTNVTAIINSAGRAVVPSFSTVQSAMRHFEPKERTAPIPKYLIDAPSDTAYPLCFWTMVVLRRNLTSVRECLGVRAYLSYQVWAISNQRAKDSVPIYGISYLTSPYQSRVMNILPTITCNKEAALSYSSMSGMGVVAPFVSSWGSFYDEATTPLQITYYPETTLYDGIDQIEAGNVDFGTTLLTSEPTFSRQTGSDLQYLPIAAFALSLGYNLPELEGHPPLTLDLETVALFYTGEIRWWNDTRIQALNLGAPLPNAQIILPLAAEDTSMVLLTQALAAVNPQIAALAANANSSIYALLGSPGVVLTTSVVSSVNRTAYSFGAMPRYRIASLQSTYDFVSEALVINSQGTAIAPTEDGVLAAMYEYESAINSELKTALMPTTGNNSYPLASYAYAVISMSQMTDCTRAQELVQWMWWALTSSSGQQLAQANNVLLPLESTKRQILSKLVDVTCQGVYVNSLRPCVNNGSICSDAGSCVDGSCICNPGRTGVYCEANTSSDDLSGAAIAGIVVGTVIPAILLLLCMVATVILVALYLRRNKEDEEWVIDASEIEFEELIGTGGFGEVRKAVWRGTDVAVKTVASGNVTNDMRNAFIDEVRVMTSLRHPNVVLFMGAATKPPKMCIVMEFMSLGSLYDVLHNELLVELPYQLRIKMMRQAAKGMYFLHSSGIVHRDLKSLNLLLDAKWNVKVSDFGLTKFQDQMKKEGQNQQLELGSIHWSAPEVLSEKPGIDYEAADVYSFGIILWEVITREDVYAGMSPAAVAVAVLRDDIRPPVPDTAPGNYAALMTNCWDSEPTVRPKFLEIMTRLESLEEKSSGGWGSMSATTSFGWGAMTGSSSTTGGTGVTGGSNSSDGSTSSDGVKGVLTGVKPPTGEVTIVFTDVVKAGALWEFNAEAMKDATILHNDTLRSRLAQFKGYEVVSNREGNTGGMSTGGEGSLCIVFQDALKALEWCMAAQQQLLTVDWPPALLAHPAAAEEWGDTDDRLIFKGLRVRMGVHLGEPRRLLNAISRRAAYVGPSVHTAARITTMTHGGQIVISQTVYNKIRGSDLCKEKKRLLCLGKYEMPDAPEGVQLYELRTKKLEARFFGGTTNVAYNYTTTSDSNPSGEEDGDTKPSQKRLTNGYDGDYLEEELSGPSSGSGAGGSGVLLLDEGAKEEAFLTSANLCRWIIDYSDIKIGKQIGMGSYGLVFHGRWKGIEVAVKRFIKQKLTERRLLEFRAEMAFLSELHHPNIVVFIGACVKKPNLCIVTEFVKQGALRDILYDAGTPSAMMASTNGRGAGNAVIKLEWKQRLRMLRSAAAGINYLHTLDPVIIHRDLKSSNLLVDENWNVKVADFGFARLKEENATMTRCGTPCWTAPEVIRGERYSEKADVYSFGIIMWEVLARRTPFAGRNFMGVSLDVLEGKRPQVPADCPDSFRRMMERCWHAKPDKRPTMESVVEFLDKLIGDGASDLHV